MNIRKLACACAAVALASLVPLVTGTVHAQTAPAAQPTVVTAVEVADQEPGQPIILAAQLVDQGGRPLGGNVLQFYVLPGVFGADALMQVGQATTDGTGTARFPYRPTWLGEVEAVALFAGTPDLAASQGRFHFNAIGPVKVHENAAFGLQQVRDWAPVVVALLVAAIWATFITVIARVAMAMRAGADKPSIAASARVFSAKS